MKENACLFVCLFHSWVSIIYKQAPSRWNIRLLFRIWSNTHSAVLQTQSAEWLSVFCEVNVTRFVLCLQMRGQPTQPPCDIIRFVHGQMVKLSGLFFPPVSTKSLFPPSNLCFYDRYRLCRQDNVWPLDRLLCLFGRLLSPASSSHSWCHIGHWYIPQDCHSACGRVHSAVGALTPPTSFLCEHIRTNVTGNRRDAFCGRFSSALWTSVHFIVVCVAPSERGFNNIDKCASSVDKTKCSFKVKSLYKRT